ncbi:MAG: HAMP domain-containing sensor histidine kinase [Phormidesmis sp.]
MPPDLSSSDRYSTLQLAYQRLLVLERFKSGFLARTSHELRSPINVIVSLHQLILEDLCEGPEEEKEFLVQSKSAALKMLALFDQIAAVSKLDVGREPPMLEPIELSFALPEVEMLTALQAANQNVRYTVEPVDEDIQVVTDSKWLKNILVSLIQDAIPHSKKLRLAVEKTAGSIAVVIESDRPATDLQAELDSIATAIDLSSEAAPDLSLEVENIQLSTGLVLATAYTALPLIEGSFSIEPHSDLARHSYLRCTFPSAAPQPN